MASGRPPTAVMLRQASATACLPPSTGSAYFPVVSGNVSLYNETEGVGILPTPTIGGVGVVDDVSRRRGRPGAAPPPRGRRPSPGRPTARASPWWRRSADPDHRRRRRGRRRGEDRDGRVQARRRRPGADRRQDAHALGLVVERDVAGHDREVEGAAGLADALDVVDDVEKIATVAFKRDGDALVLIGATKGWLGQSGKSRARQASPMPWMQPTNWPITSGFSGLPKLRLSRPRPSAASAWSTTWRRSRRSRSSATATPWC
jgi:hypothetical protein